MPAVVHARLPRLVAVLGAVFALVWPAPAQPQPAPAASVSASAVPPASASAPLPAGHPPVAAQAGGLPAGHPSVAGSETEQKPPEDSSTPTKALPAGTLEVTLLDASERPLSDIDVRLGILRETIAEGETRESKTARSDPLGKVVFTGLSTESNHSYRVSVPRGPAAYAAAPFQFRKDMGQSVVLHVFPVTQDIAQAMVAMRTIVAIEPRDDVFQIEVLFRVFNIGKVTWVPKDVALELPQGAKGFNAQESMSDTRFVADGERRVRMLGTYVPGQRDAIFRFQVPNHGKSSAEFRLGLPPHVASLRVLAQSAPGMELRAEGFAAAEPVVDNNGQRLLLTDRQMQPGDAQLRALAIRLSGLPTPGPGQWIAVALAAALAVSGMAAAKQAPKQPAKLAREDALRAHSLLIDELVALEKARRKKQIGPATYESTRRQLVEAIARLATSNPAQPADRRKRSPVEATVASPS
jgi:hypothetical protein